MKSNEKKCVLCGREFKEYGNNPEPLKHREDGRCCNECNALKVVPARIDRLERGLHIYWVGPNPPVVDYAAR